MLVLNCYAFTFVTLESINRFKRQAEGLKQLDRKYGIIQLSSIAATHGRWRPTAPGYCATKRFEYIIT